MSKNKNFHLKKKPYIFKVKKADHSIKVIKKSQRMIFFLNNKNPKFLSIDLIIRQVMLFVIKKVC